MEYSGVAVQAWIAGIGGIGTTPSPVTLFQRVPERSRQPTPLPCADSTYLFRFAGDHVGYHDLNTKLALRKRQRATRADDDEQFLQPEKVRRAVFLGGEGPR